MTLISNPITALALSALLCGAALAQETPKQMTMAEVSAAYQAGDHAAARAGITALAEAGDLTAAFRLGYMIANAEGGPFDRLEAIKWLEKALPGEHPGINLLLARVYMSDNPEVTDYIRAAELLEVAIANGSAEAHFYLAQLHRIGRGVEGDKARAFALMNIAGKADMPEAAFALAEMYSRGEGTAKDDVQASRWLLNAAELGHAEALMSLYYNYARGTGFPKDEGKARQYLQAAAQAGHVLAARVHGTSLLLGAEGYETDVETGLKFLRYAAERGEPGAEANLAYAYMQGVGVEKDVATAVELYKRAANRGLMRAALAVGQIFLAGQGVEVDYAEAGTYLQIAAFGKDETAMRLLAQMLLDGTLEGKEPENSVLWMSKLAAVGETEAGESEALAWLRTRAGLDPYAAYETGRIYFEGLGTEAAPDQAFRYLGSAARAGFGPAQELLAELYATGAGTEQDFIEAHKWVNIAAAGGSDTAVERRDTLAQLMTAEQVAEAQDRARRFMGK